MTIRSLMFVLLVWSPAAATASSQHDIVYAVAKQAIDGLNGKDLGYLRQAIWRDGFHTVVRRDHGAEPLTRHWDQVPFSGIGVNVSDQWREPSISIHGDRAEMTVAYTYRIDNVLDEKPRECGNGVYRFDLRRRDGEWRVLNLTSEILQSSDRCG